MTDNQMICKSCGARLELSETVNGIVRCAYCGNSYTVPRQDATPNEYVWQGKFESDICEFDKALTAFDKAVKLDDKEPEAYWGRAIARFRVQFLNDYVNARLQPICHEISEKAFTQDADYLNAIRYATAEQRFEYERIGKEIDHIRKEFFKLKSKGVHYDCFICAKVTDDASRLKTVDCDYANRLYDDLRDDGYYPFFSERELKNRTGADYEANILYALYSAQTMIIVCGNDRYLQTPWIKNEYARFIRLINNEEKEEDTIAIAYLGQPIERLPNRDGKLQGVDLTAPDAFKKLNKFVVAHIAKEVPHLVRKEYGASGYKKKNVIKSQIQRRKLTGFIKAELTVSEQSKLRIAKGLLEEQAFQSAIERCKSIINTNPSCSEAYWIVFLAENKCVDGAMFENGRNHISDYTNLESAIAMSNAEQKTEYYTALYKRAKNSKDINIYNEYVSLPDSSKKAIQYLTDCYFDDLVHGSYFGVDNSTEMFESLIKTVTNVDRYIEMNMTFARVYNKPKYYKSVLEADAENYEAQYKWFIAENNLQTDVDLATYCFNKSHYAEIEQRLYSYGFNKYATERFARMCNNAVKYNGRSAVEFFEWLLTLIPVSENEYMIRATKNIVSKLIACGAFELAQGLNYQIIAVDKNDCDAYFNRVLIKNRFNNAAYLIDIRDRLYDDPDYSYAMDAYSEVHPEDENPFLYMVKKMKSASATLETGSCSIDDISGAGMPMDVSSLKKWLDRLPNYITSARQKKMFAEEYNNIKERETKRLSKPWLVLVVGVIAAVFATFGGLACYEMVNGFTGIFGYDFFWFITCVVEMVLLVICVMWWFIWRPESKSVKFAVGISFGLIMLFGFASCIAAFAA